MRNILWFCLPAALLFVLLPGTAAAKSATAPTCGATITTSITLSADLDCSGGGVDGLTVGKDGIVINLNGHTITGAGGADGYNGVSNYGFNNVTVKNGTIKNFEDDYSSEHAHGETVTNVTFVLDGSQQYTGLYTEYGGGNTYSNNTATNAHYGFETYGTAGDMFMHNDLRGNDYGVYEEYSQGQTWMQNNFGHSTHAGYDEDYGSPILIANASSHNGTDGFYIDGDGGYGNAVMKYNVANSNGTFGIYAYENYSSGYQGSKFVGNQTNHNKSSGFYSYYDWKSKFQGNTSNGNGGYGFYFYESAGYVVTGNLAKNNKNDGVYFYTDYSYWPTLVAMNSSFGNMGYGFNADAGIFGSWDAGSGNSSGLFYNVSG